MVFLFLQFCLTACQEWSPNQRQSGARQTGEDQGGSFNLGMHALVSKAVEIKNSLALEVLLQKGQRILGIWPKNCSRTR